jgi:hypothetical protein
MTPFLIKIDRISCRVNPRSFLDWIKKKRPMEARTCVTKSFLGDDAAALAPLNAIEHASRRWRGDLISTQVENVEIERMRLHMERDGKGEMNCWAALGMDAAAGEAAYADAQKSSDKQEQDLDPEAFEDDGKNEFKIPLRDLIDNASVEKWYDIEPTADKPLKEGEKSAQIKLSIELHGVKAVED